MVVKRSIAKLVRKKLSDITNTQMQHKLHNQAEKPADKNCIEELLKEKAAMMQLLAERDKIIELTGAELLRLRANVEKLQLQNWNLAQSNGQMLAELNSGRERMKALQHQILCKAALLQGKNSEVRGTEDMDHENDGSLLKEGGEKAEQPLAMLKSFAIGTENQLKGVDVNARNFVLHRIYPPSQSCLTLLSNFAATGSVSTSIKNANESKEKKEIRSQLRRRSARFRAHEYEPMKKNSSGTENAGSHHNILNSLGREDETFGKPSRKTQEKAQPCREIPPRVKLRRLESFQQQRGLL